MSRTRCVINIIISPSIECLGFGWTTRWSGGSVRSGGSIQAGSGDRLDSFSMGIGAVWGISAGTWSCILTPVYAEFKSVSSYIYTLPFVVVAWSLTFSSLMIYIYIYIYIYRTAPLTSRCCILYIYSTNIRTEYFKHAAHSSFFPLQNAVYFIMLPFLVPVLFTF